MSGDFKTDNLLFPLCCLSFNNIDNLYDNIISYSVYKYAEFLMDKDVNEFTGIKLYCEDLDEINNYVDKHNVKGFSSSSDFHSYLIISGIKLGINFYNIKNIISGYNLLNNEIVEFERRNLRDVKVNIHKDMVFNVRDKIIDNNTFRVYCAIKAIVGNKDFKRITIERIKYGMLGYKSKKVYDSEFIFNKDKNNHHRLKMFPVPLTDRQIRTIIDKLIVKKLIDKYTYRRRSTYYTTKPNLRGDKFAEKIADFIADRKISKNSHKIQDSKIESMIDVKYSKKLAKRLSFE